MFSLFHADDGNRVKLWPYPNEKGSDYINASFIDVSMIMMKQI
jgi:protein tyrosine phosphatase